MYSSSLMDFLSGPLLLCLLLLLVLQLGAAAAGGGEEAGAAAGTSAGVAGPARGAPTVGSLLPTEGAASAMGVKRGPAMSLNDPPLTSAQGTRAKASRVAQGSALLHLPKQDATRRDLARKLLHSRAEAGRMAWSTPLPTNASCLFSNFCLPPNCLVSANGFGSYSFCGNTIGSSTTQPSTTACYQQCSSKGAALFQFSTYTSSCKCYKNIQSLSFTTKDSYTIGYTQGLCPYCAAGQAYNPMWGALCQDCGDCLSRPSISGSCYNAYEKSIKFSSAGTYQIWYNVENCPSATKPDETGTWSIPRGGNSFTCVAIASPTTGGAGSVQFSSVNNCNSVLFFSPSTACASGVAGNGDYEYFKGLPFYTLPTRAAC